MGKNQVLGVEELAKNLGLKSDDKIINGPGCNIFGSMHIHCVQMGLLAVRSFCWILLVGLQLNILSPSRRESGPFHVLNLDFA